MSIVREFSKMLSSIPHDQAFTQLLIDQIVTYYDKCFGWYKSAYFNGIGAVKVLYLGKD